MNMVEILQKIRNRTTIWSSYSAPGYLSKGYENINSKRCTHCYVHCSFVYNSQDKEMIEGPIDRLMDKKMWYACTHSGILHSHKNVNSCHLQYKWALGVLCYLKCQMERIVYDFTHMWNVKSTKIIE